MLYKLPIPISSEIFEYLVCDLLNMLHNTTSFSLYGRNGQNQNGIDIISYEKGIYCQCKLRKNSPKNTTERKTLINEIMHDINTAMIRSDANIEKIIVATSIENDTKIQDYFGSLCCMTNVKIEFWSWDDINNNLFLFSNILNKYYNFRKSSIELARLEVLSRLVYRQSKDNQRVYFFHNHKRASMLPVFDVSFINNTEETILLNTIQAHSRVLFIARCGNYDKPAGTLKVTKKYHMPLILGKNFGEEGTSTLNLKDPLYVYPKSPFRIQIQCDQPIIGYRKVRFSFLFNTGAIISPDIFFNSDYVGGGLLNPQL